MHFEKTKVSVIIPTHNRAKLVGRAIRSVLNQTFQNFEIIVIDDGSSDDTSNVVKKFRDSRIKYIKHEISMGGPAARNTGIKKSVGEFIGLLDDDDEWLPTKLEKQLKHFDFVSFDVGLIYCGYDIVDKNGSLLNKVIPDKRGNIFLDLLNYNMIGSPTNLIRKKCFDEVGLFDENLKSCQDWDMWLRISRVCKIDYVSEILARYYILDNRISTNLDNVISGNVDILSKYECDLIGCEKIYSDHLRHIGMLYGFNNDFENGLKYFKISIKINNRNVIAIGEYLLLIASKKHFKYFIECILSFKSKRLLKCHFDK